MSNSFLNPVNLNVGDVIVITDEGNRFLRPLHKVNPAFKKFGEYEITEIVKGRKRDDLTDLDVESHGVTKMKNLENGIEFDINDLFLDEKDDYWAFVTNHTPDYFIIRKRNFAGDTDEENQV